MGLRLLAASPILNRQQLVRQRNPLGARGHAHFWQRAAAHSRQWQAPAKIVDSYRCWEERNRHQAGTVAAELHSCYGHIIMTMDRIQVPASGFRLSASS